MPGRLLRLIAAVLATVLLSSLLTPVAVSASTDPYADAVTASTPKAWWRLNETSGTAAADSSGNGHTATLLPGDGEASWGWRGAGATGTSLRLDGGGRVDLPDSVAGEVSRSALTVECWVYIPQLPAQATCMSLGVDNTDRFEVTIGASSAAASVTADVTVRYGTATQTAVAAARAGWNHVVVTNGTYVGFAVFVNGASVSAPGAASSAWSTNPTVAGVIGGDRVRVDEVALYRRKLSNTEIADHYNAGLESREPVEVTSLRRAQDAPEFANAGGYGVVFEWEPYTGLTDPLAGYRVLRDGELVETLPASATRYGAPDPTMSGGWSVVAFSATEESRDVPVGSVGPQFNTDLTRPEGLDLTLGSDAAILDWSADLDRVLLRSKQNLTNESHTTGRNHLFVHERSTGRTWRANTWTREEPNAAPYLVSSSNSTSYALSDDGRYVAYVSTATNLVDEDGDGDPGVDTGTPDAYMDVFRWEVDTGKVDRASENLRNWGSSEQSINTVRINADGTQVLYGTARDVPDEPGCPPGSTGRTYVWSRQYSANQTPIDLPVIRGATSSMCANSVTQISPSGRYVLVGGSNWKWWVLDRDPDGNNVFDEQAPPAMDPVPSPIGNDHFMSSGGPRGSEFAERPDGSFELIMHARSYYNGCDDCVLAWSWGETSSRIIASTKYQLGKIGVSADGRYILYRKGLYPKTSPSSQYNLNSVYRVDRDTDGNGVYDEPGTVRHEPLHHFKHLSPRNDSDVQLEALDYTGRYAVARTSDHQILGPEDTPGTDDIVLWDFDAGAPKPPSYRNSSTYDMASTGAIADPIIASTGNFTHQESLLTFPAPAADLDLVATYNHQDPEPGILGTGWVTPLDVRVTETTDAIGPLADLRTANGDHVLYREGDGHWEPVTESDTTTLHETTGGWERRHIDGAVETFDADGRWVSTTFADDSTLTVTRDSNGDATGIAHSSGFAYEVTRTDDTITFTQTDTSGSRSTTAHLNGSLLHYIDLPDDTYRVFTTDTSGRVQRIATQTALPRPLGFDRAVNLAAGHNLSAGNWIPSRDALSVEAWVSDPNPLPGGTGERLVVSKHNNSTTGEFTVGVLDSGGIRFTTRDAAGVAHSLDAAVAWTQGASHHVAVTWDGSTKRIYFDGTEVANTPWTGVLQTTTQALRIGRPSTGPPGFVGVVDEVAVYGHALDSSDVDRHFTLGHDGSYDEEYATAGPLTSGADALWRFADRRSDVPGPANLTPSSGAPVWTAGLLTGLGESRLVLENTYDADNRAVAQLNPSGAATEIDYDVAPSDPQRPRVTESTDDVSGDVTRFEMLADGTTSQVVGADGVTRARTVSGGHLTGLSEATATQSFVRDPATGIVSQWVRADGSTVDAVFDAADRPVEVTVEGVTVAELTYTLADTDPDARSDRQPVEVTDADGSTIEFTYDNVAGARRLVAMTDADGVVTEFTYDARGLLESSTADPAGEEITTSFTYDAFGWLASTTLPGGRTWGFVHTPNGDLQMVAAPNWAQTFDFESFGRNRFGDVVSHNQRAGDVTTYTYDAAGLLESSTDADGVTTSYGRNAAGEIVSVTDPAGTTTFELGPMARVDATVDPTGRRTTYTYNHAGQPLTATSVGDPGDPGDDLTETWTYDAAGRVLTYTDRAGGTTTWTYDEWGRVTSEADPTGVVTGYGYSPAGRLLDTTTGLEVTSYVYTPAGRLTSATDGDGVARELTYDTAGRPATMSEGGATTEITYGTDAQVASFDRAGELTSYTRDLNGRITGIDSPDGVVEVGFDNADRPTTYTVDPGGPAEGTWTYTYTPAGRLSEVLDPVGTHSEYGFDAAGREVSLTMNGELQSTTTFDAAGRVTGTDSLAAGETTFSFDAHGRTVGILDESGRNAALTLDGEGRTVGELHTLTGQPDVTVSRSFDAAGRVTATTDGGGTSTWDWDTTPAPGPSDPGPTGRLVSRTDPSGVLTYDWTDAGRLAARTVAPATGPPQLTEFTYDTDGLLTTLDAPGGTSVFTWVDGRLTAEDHPGINRARSYDAAGRLTEVSNDDGTIETAFSYTYDPLGRPATQTRTVDGDPLTDSVTAWDYDAAGQLTAQTHTGTSPAPDRTWTWATGRLDAATVGDETRDFTWTAGRLTAAAVDPSAAPGDEFTASFTYDASGRQTAWSTPVASVARTFDAAGRLDAATRTQGAATWTEARSYRAGQLAAVAVDDGTSTAVSQLWFDDGGWSPAPEHVADPQGTTAALIATFDGTTWTPETAAPASGGAGGAHAPPTAGLVDGFGTGDGVAGDPFGDPAAAPAAPVERGVRGTVTAGVSGFDVTAPTALLHLSARDVDPAVGFIAPDPLAALPGTPDVANGFAAHGNTPTTLWDLSGLRPNYGEGSRHGLLGQVLEVAAWVPGLDTFADIGLCALEVGSAVGGDGDMALLAASCASVFVVGVGAGAARASVHGYRAVNKALDARRGADKLTDAGRNTARRQPPARPCTSNSFTGDTEVLMGDGTRVPIRDVQVGDEVVASDPVTGTTGVHAVSALIVGAGVKDMVAVTVATDDGERHDLDATGGHPFWVENRRAWVDAADLEPGDVLVGAEGEQARVAEVEQRRALLRVHNLTVDGPHTYHVATGDTAVLVHNSKCGSTPHSPTHYELTKAGAKDGKDSHHIIQHAAVKDVPGYSRGRAPAIQLQGPPHARGTEHHAATQAQRQTIAGGTYGAEREVGACALRAAGCSEAVINDALERADTYFMGELGLGLDSPLRVPGGRRR